MEKICHICPAEAWRTAIEAGLYRADSLQAEGFIHCSKPGQIMGVANRYFSGVSGLVLLWIDPQKLAAELRYEISEGDVYPHLYGPLNLEAVAAVTAFVPDADGVFRVFREAD